MSTTTPSSTAKPSRKPWLALLFLASAALCAGLSLLGIKVAAERRINDVLLVIDITQSMNVKDARLDGAYVTRLDFAKRASQEALLHWPCGSKLALAVFSAHRSFVLFKSVEVCHHHDELWSAIDSLDWRSAWVSRSEVSKGLFSALKVLPQIGKHTRAVFVTDGHEAPPLHETYRPKLSQKIERNGGIIVGVGGDQPVRIPKFGPNGESQGFWRASEVLQVDTYRMGRANGEAMAGVDVSDLDSRIAAGREHLSWLKAEHLQGLAATTEMEYKATPTLESFVDAMNSPGLHHAIDGERPLAPLFALAAAVFFMLRLATPWVPSQRKAKKTKHRAETAPKP